MTLCDTRLVSSGEEDSSSLFGNKCAKIGNQLQIDQLEFVFRLGLGRLADLPHTSDRSSGLCSPQSPILYAAVDSSYGIVYDWRDSSGDNWQGRNPSSRYILDPVVYGKLVLVLQKILQASRGATLPPDWKILRTVDLHPLYHLLCRVQEQSPARSVCHRYVFVL